MSGKNRMLLFIITHFSKKSKDKTFVLFN
jgi:hypothetical protein